MLRSSIRIGTVTVVSLLSLFSSLAVGDDETKKSPAQTPQTLDAKVVRDVSLQYLLYLPEGYEATAEKKWPLILFLHGAGERGDDLERVKVHGPPKLVENGKKLPFIVVSPQCPTGRFWSDVTLIALLDEVVKNHQVDEDRVYLTGLSMGGFGTWSLAANYPERFAAIAPICGGGSLIYGFTLRDMPIWAFHGAKDEVVPPEESERLIERIKRRGGGERIRLTIYPEAGHDAWTATYANDELYEWFLSHRREKRAE